MDNHRANPLVLTREIYDQAIAELAHRDPRLAAALAAWGAPPFWAHPPGFAGIVLGILAQQVSLESARATFARLEATLGAVEPERFLTLDEAALKTMGLSRQKASYARGVAEDVVTRRLDLASLQGMDDETARARLMQIRGIGAWTAGVYMLLALRRRDAWPAGDLAVAKAIQELDGLPETPATEEAERIAERWRPWRAVAARMLWHYYLSKRNRTGSAPAAWSA